MKPIGKMTPEEFLSFLESSSHQCLFRPVITPDDARRVVDVVEEWGDGDIREGIEVMRENGHWTKKQRELEEEREENNRWVSAKRLEEKTRKDTVQSAALRWGINAWLLIMAMALWEYVKAKMFGG